MSPAVLQHSDATVVLERAVVLAHSDGVGVACDGGRHAMPKELATVFCGVSGGCLAVRMPKELATVFCGVSRGCLAARVRSARARDVCRVGLAATLDVPDAVASGIGPIGATEAEAVGLLTATDGVEQRPAGATSERGALAGSSGALELATTVGDMGCDGLVFCRSAPAQ